MEKQKSNKLWLIPALLAVAALIVAVGLNINALSPKTQDSGKEVIVQIPSYLSKNQSPGLDNTLLPSSNDGVISLAADDSGNSKRLISVTGTVSKTAAPDKAEIILSVETLDKSAAKSQSDNAELSQKVRDALKAAGVDDADIKTSSYNLYEDFQWNESLRKSESIGFKTVNSIQVTVKDLSKTGSVIDAAVQAGANSVSSVSFSLNKQGELELRNAALQEAAANAKTKAQNIATGLGISVGQVFSASESSNYYTPVYRSYDMAAGVAESATTPITPGDVEYSVSVSVQFEIQ